MNILLALKGLIYKPRVNKLLNRVQTYLESLDRSVKAKSKLLKPIDSGAIFVSIREYQSYIDKQQQFKDYLEQGDPFALNQITKTEFDKLSKWAVKTSKYTAITQLYGSIKQQSNYDYLRILDQLKSIQQHNMKYDRRINQAFKDLKQYKEDYITNSQKKRFEKKYEEVYRFFRGASKEELSKPQHIFKTVFSDLDAFFLHGTKNTFSKAFKYMHHFLMISMVNH